MEYILKPMYGVHTEEDSISERTNREGRGNRLVYVEALSIGLRLPFRLQDPEDILSTLQWTNIKFF